MLVKLGSLAADVAGSAGGLTMQRSPFGTVARSKPLPTRRQNRYTGDSRQRLATLSRLWRTLSPAQRADWNMFAGTVSWYNRFGDPVTGSGYRAFLRCNLASHASDGAIAQLPFQLTAPEAVNSTLPASPEFVLDTGSNSLLLASPDATVDSETLLFLFASQPFPAGRSVCYTPQPFLMGLTFSTPLPADLSAAYAKLHGRLPSAAAGEVAFLRVQARNARFYWPGLSTVLRLVYT